jgi:beta-galactosidase GanA
VICTAALAVGASTSAVSSAHSVSFDSYSFLIDGKRTYLWSSEFHPFRLPSPDLWPDIFQKMKAAGFNTADGLRGPYNEGGLFGERAGWPASNGREPQWEPATLPTANRTPGVTWYRTDVTLALPKDQDTSVGLQVNDPPGRHYRATLFVNGWQMGSYVSDLGPQHSFPIPSGILQPQGSNALVLAVWKIDQSEGDLGEVSLVNYGSYKTGR